MTRCQAGNGDRRRECISVNAHVLRAIVRSIEKNVVWL